VVFGLGLFGVVFAINSSIHSPRPQACSSEPVMLAESSGADGD